MINLLPTQKKEEIRKNYLFRLAVVSGLLFGFAVFSFGAVLLSFYVILGVEKSGATEALEPLKEEAATKVDIDTLNAVEEKLNVLGLETENVLATEAITILISNKDDDIKISEITYKKTQTWAGINIKGVAATRESLLKFIRSLEDEEKFVEVDSPISDLGESRDIQFTIDIETKEDEQ